MVGSLPFKEGIDKLFVAFDIGYPMEVCRHQNRCEYILRYIGWIIRKGIYFWQNIKSNLSNKRGVIDYCKTAADNRQQSEFIEVFVAEPSLCTSWARTGLGLLRFSLRPTVPPCQARAALSDSGPGQPSSHRDCRGPAACWPVSSQHSQWSGIANMARNSDSSRSTWFDMAMIRVIQVTHSKLSEAPGPGPRWPGRRPGYGSGTHWQRWGHLQTHWHVISWSFIPSANPRSIKTYY